MWGIWLTVNVAAAGLIVWGALMDAEVVWFALLSPAVNVVTAANNAASNRDQEGARTERLVSAVLATLVGFGTAFGLWVLGGLSSHGLFGVEPSPEEKFLGQILNAAAVATLLSLFATYLVYGSSRDR